MTKRRLEDEGFANVLRQKPKEDPILKQQNSQNTFAMLMKAQQQRPIPTKPTVSYQYFNNNNTLETKVTCYKCPNAIFDKCKFCEHQLCQSCLQQCNSCQYLYCSTCSILDYSQSIDQVFCISCRQG